MSERFLSSLKYTTPAAEEQGGGEMCPAYLVVSLEVTIGEDWRVNKLVVDLWSFVHSHNHWIESKSEVEAMANTHEPTSTSDS